MPNDATFLEAIRREPGSLDPILVYSDWLQERGDPRGEFIQAQCQVNRLASWRPDRLEFEARARALLLHHEEQWLGPLLGRVSNWEFRNGLIDWVTVETETFLAQAESWLPALPLMGLHLRKAKGHTTALANCPQLAHVNQLFLGDNRLDANDFRPLAQSPYLRQLRTLYLHSNDLNEEAITLLSSSPTFQRLRVLSLGNIDLMEALRILVRSTTLRRLRFLNLLMCFVGEEGVQVLANSPLLAQLRGLYMGCNLLPAGCLQTLVESPALANLRTLDCSMAECSDADIEALARSPHVANLRTLGLDSNRQMGDASLQALANSPHLKNLKNLSFGPGRWTQKGIEALGITRNLPRLRWLRLSQSGEESQLPHLLGGRVCRQLRDLHLRYRPIGATSLQALASHPPPLPWRKATLDLGDDTSPSWESLLQQGHLREITELSLGTVPASLLSSLLVPERLPRLRALLIRGVQGNDEQWHQFLTGPLVRQLDRFTLGPQHEEQGEIILKHLVSVSPALSLYHLKLSWSLTPNHVRLLTASSRWPNLTELHLGSYRMETEGMRLLARWPILRQLRFLHFHNISSRELPGVDEIARSPHARPLLRVDISNGSVPRNDFSRIRARMGLRFAAFSRKLPRLVTIGNGAALGHDD